MPLCFYIAGEIPDINDVTCLLTGDESVQGVRNTMSDSEWRHRFVDAMLFREKSEADKMVGFMY